MQITRLKQHMRTAAALFTKVRNAAVVLGFYKCFLVIAFSLVFLTTVYMNRYSYFQDEQSVTLLRINRLTGERCILQDVDERNICIRESEVEYEYPNAPKPEADAKVSLGEARPLWGTHSKVVWDDEKTNESKGSAPAQH